MQSEVNNMKNEDIKDIKICDISQEASDIDLDKYINPGERLFKTDAQKYISKLRDEKNM